MASRFSSAVPPQALCIIQVQESSFFKQLAEQRRPVAVVSKSRVFWSWVTVSILPSS